MTCIATEVLLTDPHALVRVCQQLESRLPGWTADGVIAFGSTARDEATPSSDLDLWFIGHSLNEVHLDREWRKGRFAEATGRFTASWSDLPITEINTWDEIQTAVPLPARWRYGCPIADTRWFLWQLAEECEWQTFLFLATSQVLFDPRSFLQRLVGFLWAERPFHIHPDGGMIYTLRKLCDGEKSRLLADMGWLCGTRADDASMDHTRWLWPAVECVRDTVVLLTLLRQGRPVYRREDVLRFVGDAFPEHYQVAQRVYEMKCSDVWRRQIMKLDDYPDPELLGQLQRITEELLAFWHAAMCAADLAILHSESTIPYAIDDWRAENHRRYRRFFKAYQDS